jgi:hypothetical protein
MGSLRSIRSRSSSTKDVIQDRRIDPYRGAASSRAREACAQSGAHWRRGWPMPPVKTNGMEPLEQTGVSTGELRRRVNAFLNRSESAAFLSEFLAGPSRELRIAAAAVARRIVSIKTIWA